MAVALLSSEFHICDREKSVFRQHTKITLFPAATPFHTLGSACIELQDPAYVMRLMDSNNINNRKDNDIS
jgi:hypothetical protein